MIEKLKEHNVIDPKTDKIVGTIGCDLREIMDKLNEVVDAVNELQESQNTYWTDIAEIKKELQTPAKKVHKETFVSIDEALKMGKKVATMSDMKCPFCNGELVGTIGHPICRNQDCVMCDDPMPQDLLEELIRTRKALDKAKLILKNLLPYLNGYERLDVEKAIKEITALEQKDGK